MLRFSKKVEYALIAMLYMADKDPGELTTARELSDKYDISLELMGKLLQSLTRHDLITSVQGAKGGYFRIFHVSYRRSGEWFHQHPAQRLLGNCNANDRRLW